MAAMSSTESHNDMEIINSAILEKAYKVQYYVEAAVLHK